jgi:hypothetical protein
VRLLVDRLEGKEGEGVVGETLLGRLVSQGMAYDSANCITFLALRSDCLTHPLIEQEQRKGARRERTEEGGGGRLS